jgi:hypothetical protein
MDKRANRSVSEPEIARAAECVHASVLEFNVVLGGEEALGIEAVFEEFDVPARACAVGLAHSFDDFCLRHSETQLVHVFR